MVKNPVLKPLVFYEGPKTHVILGDFEIHDILLRFLNSCYLT